MGESLITLSERFNKTIFRIPDYQRGYAWTDSQRIDFWEDLVNLNDEHYHYTGMLSIIEVKKDIWQNWVDDKWLIESAGYKPFYVVDGQQRLTTCIILINEILNLAKLYGETSINYLSLEEIRATYIVKQSSDKIKRSYLFGYETDNPSFKCLRYEILEEEGSPDVEKTFYTQNLVMAKLFFKEHLEDIYGRYGFSAIEKLFKKLTTNFKFNVHEIGDGFDVFVAFETMNNRGKKLSNLELLKNRLIYLTTLFDNSVIDEDGRVSLRNIVNDSWKEVYKELGRKKDKLLNDDEYLRAHWSLYFTYSRNKGDDYIKYLLKQKFTPQNIFDEVLAFNDDIDEQEDIIDNDLDEEPIELDTDKETKRKKKLKPSEIKNYVVSLQKYAKYWYYTYFPMDSQSLSSKEKMYVDKLNKVGINYFRPLVMIAISAGSSPEYIEKRVRLLQAIERFIFICFRLGMFQASYKSSQFYIRAKQLMQNPDIIDEIIEELENYSNDNIKDALDKFKSRMLRNYKSYFGYYSWRDLRYFLYEYEFKRYMETHIPKLDDEDYFAKSEKDKVSIEHIYPQTHDEWYWTNQFRDYSDNEKWLLEQSLGNLLPLSQSVNSQLQNYDFATKKQRYSIGSHSEVEVSQNEDWNPKNIYDRGVLLMKFMDERWKLGGISPEYIEEVLNIGFVNDGRTETAPVPFFESENKSKTELKNKFKKQNKSMPISLEEYLFNKEPRLVELFNDLKERIYDTCPDITEYVLPQYVTYRRNGTNFVEIHIQKANLQILTLSPSFDAQLGDRLSDAYNWSLNYRTYITQQEELCVLIKIIADSYSKR